MKLEPLPVEIRPRGWRAWFGPRGFIIHPDGLSISGLPGRISFGSISQIQMKGTGVSLSIPDGDGTRALLLWGGDDPKRLSEFLENLVSEALEWRETWKTTVSLSTFKEQLRKILEWKSLPFVRGTDFIGKMALETGASDVHIEPLEHEARVTSRTGQILRDLGTYPIGRHAGVLARLKILAGCHPHLVGIPQEGSWSIPGPTPDRKECVLKGPADVRIAIFPSLYGERCSMRFIRPIDFPDIVSLGWRKELADDWRNLLDENQGLFLITGPIGSGKTTALYATLSELAHSLDKPLQRVATLEDPVEGKVQGICQSSLDPKAGLGLAEGFKFLLRQDPDIMALGEIRDRECLREALQAGLAGHVVLATFHAASPQSAVDRIFQMGIEPYLLKIGLRGIISLRMDRVLCPPEKRETCETCRNCGGHIRPQAEIARLEDLRFPEV